MNTCVVGLQWGDEGKGKIVDRLSETADAVIRYSGGANAGHTVIRDNSEESFKLHLLPSGILREKVLNIITNGVALDAEVLLGEIDALRERGIKIENNLRISSRAHLVMEYHKKQDQLSEEALGKAKIGTTIRGIGPCYSDKIMRTTALRVADLQNPDALKDKLKRIVGYKNTLFAALYQDQDPLNAEEIFHKCQLWAQRLTPFFTDTTALLHRLWEEGKQLLFEGAQGTLLDLDHGTFPFVTSSNASAVGLPAATGLPARAIDRYIGICKAYSTRVGSGPFPSEQSNEIGNYIREKGHEYGTTTGRPRRCGWFDAVAVGYSIRIGGIDEIVMQHLDTLSGLPELKICTGYRFQNRQLAFFPAEEAILNQVECEYETLPAFSEDLRNVNRYEDLPPAARRYVERVETILQRPVRMIGVGPGRKHLLSR